MTKHISLADQIERDAESIPETLKRYLPRANGLLDAHHSHPLFPWKESREVMAEALAMEFRAFRNEGICAAREQMQEEGLPYAKRVRRRTWYHYARRLEQDNEALIRTCNQLLCAIGKPPLAPRERRRPSIEPEDPRQ